MPARRGRKREREPDSKRASQKPCIVEGGRDLWVGGVLGHFQKCRIRRARKLLTTSRSTIRAGAPRTALALERMKPEPPLGADGKKLIRRLASSFAQCTEHAQAYGACIKIHFEGVRKGDCEAEFKALQTCFRTALTKARAKGQ